MTIIPERRAQRAAFAEDCGCCRNRLATQGGRTDHFRPGAGEWSDGHRVGLEGRPGAGSYPRRRQAAQETAAIPLLHAQQAQRGGHHGFRSRRPADGDEVFRSRRGSRFSRGPVGLPERRLAADDQRWRAGQRAHQRGVTSGKDLPGESERQAHRRRAGAAAPRGDD